MTDRDLQEDIFSINWKIALHMCGWGMRPLPDLLIAASKLGYDGVELAPAWLEKEYDLSEVDIMLQEHGMPSAPTVYAGSSNYRNPEILATEIDRVKKFCHWIKKRGGQGVIFGPVTGRNGKRTMDEERNIYSAFDVVADAVVSQGCVPLYHNHYVFSHEVSKQIFRNDLDNLDWSKWRLNLDTGHAILCLDDPVEMVDRYSSVIGWMHLKDVQKSEFGDITTPKPFMELHQFFVPLGQGIIDFPAILDILDKAGYTDWLTVEQDYSHTTPYNAARDSIEYLRSIAEV